MFELIAQCGDARRGRLHTASGSVETPVFMPCGTYGSVKAMTPETLRQVGARILLGNAFHLMLRPGDALIAELGGLSRFMDWRGPVLTDSGGFQLWSLRTLSQVSEAGARFRSPIDGAEIELTPERAIEAQQNLRSDVVMVLDDCTPYGASLADTRASMQLSLRWASRCREAFRRGREGDTQASATGAQLFGIVQGGMDSALRRESLDGLQALGFDGYAIGGLSVGEPKAEMRAVLADLLPHMPENRPRYLMGVGSPADLLTGVLLGIDMFDCVLPTRNARNGQAFTSQGPVNIRNAAHRRSSEALDPACACHTCAHYSRAYLHHLHRCREVLGSMAMTVHNLHYYHDLMTQLRGAIETGTLPSLAQSLTRGWKQPDDSD